MVVPVVQAVLRVPEVLLVGVRALEVRRAGPVPAVWVEPVAMASRGWTA